MKRIAYTTEEEQKSHAKQFGTFNDFPKDFREITEEEFAKGKFFVDGFEKMETRQMHDDDRESVFATLFFFGDGTGVAMQNEFWAGSVRYYAFGCAHDYKSLTLSEITALGMRHFGMSWHVFECKTCGHVNAYDSSD